MPSERDIDMARLQLGAKVSLVLINQFKTQFVKFCMVLVIKIINLSY